LSNDPPQPPHAGRKDAPIADMREAFARTTPQTSQDRDDARTFIQGKIEMVRTDPSLTDAEKAEAIAGLEAQRDAIPSPS
jgi:hypothetical protein